MAGNPAAAQAALSRQARTAARGCPRCDMTRYPAQFCDEHRCTALALDKTRCTHFRTHPDLGTCGIHARAKPESETEAILRHIEGRDDANARLIRRITLMPEGLSADRAFQEALVINTDEFLARVLRGDGDRGAQLRSAGFTALADALGLLDAALSRGCFREMTQQAPVLQRRRSRRDALAGFPHRDRLG